MLVRSVMWCACLMACVTSSFMLCISYQWKGPCVCFRGGEVLTQKLNREQLTSNIAYLSPQTEQHTYLVFWEATELSVPKKRILFITFCHVSFLIYLFYSPHLPRIPFFPNGFIPCAHTSCLHSALYISVSVNISDTAPDISHTSPAIPPFPFFFSTQTASFFVPGTNLPKKKKKKK